MSEASDWDESMRWEQAGVGELYKNIPRRNDRKRIDEFCDHLEGDPKVQAMVEGAPEEAGKLFDYFSDPETIQLPTPPEELER
jgi:hypothetical protein